MFNEIWINTFVIFFNHHGPFKASLYETALLLTVSGIGSFTQRPFKRPMKAKNTKNEIINISLNFIEIFKSRCNLNIIHKPQILFVSRQQSSTTKTVCSACGSLKVSLPSPRKQLAQWTGQSLIEISIEPKPFHAGSNWLRLLSLRSNWKIFFHYSIFSP